MVCLSMATHPISVLAGSVRDALNLDRGWAIREDTFRFLVDDLTRLGARTVVEFGSGVSSIRLALALPNVHIVSIENDRQLRDRLLALKSQFLGQSHSLAIELCELEWQRYANGFYLSYRADSLPGEIDAAIIDGPPVWTRRGREACLYSVMKPLKVAGRVYLDDFRRRAERRIVKNWHLAYPGSFAMSVQNVGHTVCVLEKLKEGARPQFAFPTFVDNVAQNTVLAFRWVFRGFRSKRRTPLTNNSL